MRELPVDQGPFHFIGIGGIGMSGIAEILHNLGCQVQGSDVKHNANIQRLETLGIPVFIHHDPNHLKNARIVVISSAIKPDNPEYIAAQNLGLPIVKRAEMLAELMRLKWAIAIAGTHGKTTTTSLIAALLDEAGFDPTIINGGIINAYNTNARLGSSDWMVVEADESDGTLTKLPAAIGVITNIDAEHMDFYATFDDVVKAFEQFLHNIPFYGFACLCIDHPILKTLAQTNHHRRILTYGFAEDADVQGTITDIKLQGIHFSVTLSERVGHQAAPHTLEDLFIPMSGEHNVQNALSAIAIALEIGIAPETIKQALAKFSGVKRRFTKTGEVNGITIIDDYGHHPVEIAAVLRAARSIAQGNIIAVVQPHRYSRVKFLLELFASCFHDADHVFVTDIYAAGETPIPEISQEHLIKAIRTYHPSVHEVSAATLAPILAQYAHSGDMVICLGAGTITEWAQQLPQQLRETFADTQDNDTSRNFILENALPA